MNKTLTEVGRELGVSRQYISRLAKRLPQSLSPTREGNRMLLTPEAVTALTTMVKPTDDAPKTGPAATSTPVASSPAEPKPDVKALTSALQTTEAQVAKLQAQVSALEKQLKERPAIPAAPVAPTPKVASQTTLPAVGEKTFVSLLQLIIAPLEALGRFVWHDLFHLEEK